VARQNKGMQDISRSDLKLAGLTFTFSPLKLPHTSWPQSRLVRQDDAVRHRSSSSSENGGAAALERLKRSNLQRQKFADTVPAPRPELQLEVLHTAAQQHASEFTLAAFRSASAAAAADHAAPLNVTVQPHDRLPCTFLELLAALEQGKACELPLHHKLHSLVAALRLWRQSFQLQADQLRSDIRHCALQLELHKVCGQGMCTTLYAVHVHICVWDGGERGGGGEGGARCWDRG
jgi:hypothetical protein